MGAGNAIFKQFDLRMTFDLWVHLEEKVTVVSWVCHNTALSPERTKYMTGQKRVHGQVTIHGIDEVTYDVTAGQNKSSEQKIALQYVCAPAGPVV